MKQWRMGDWAVQGAMVAALLASACSSSSQSSGSGGATGTAGHGGVGGSNTAAGGSISPVGPVPTGGMIGTNGGGPDAGTNGDAATPADGGGSTSACSGSALTNCTGTMSGAWCIDTLITLSPTDPVMRGVWSSGPTDTWVVGARPGPIGILNAGGFAFHWDGCKWTQSTLSITAGLQDVWGTSPTDVWAVGDQGTALHWNGSIWSMVPTGTTTAGLRTVSGTGSNDVWTIGNEGALHWNGSAWTAVPGLPAVPAGNTFLGDVWAVSPNNVWVALGFPDSLAHFDGTAWATTPTQPAAFGYFGIWADANTGWAVGEGLAIQQLARGNWTQVHPPGGSSEGYTNVMSLGGEAYFIGQQVAHATGGAIPQMDSTVPTGSYQGLWMTSSQVWMAGISNNAAIVIHRAR